MQKIDNGICFMVIFVLSPVYYEYIDDSFFPFDVVPVSHIGQDNKKKTRNVVAPTTHQTCDICQQRRADTHKIHHGI